MKGDGCYSALPEMAFGGFWDEGVEGSVDLAAAAYSNWFLNVDIEAAIVDTVDNTKVASWFNREG